MMPYWEWSSFLGRLRFFSEAFDMRNPSFYVVAELPELSRGKVIAVPKLVVEVRCLVGDGGFVLRRLASDPASTCSFWSDQQSNCGGPMLC